MYIYIYIFLVIIIIIIIIIIIVIIIIIEGQLRRRVPAAPDVPGAGRRGAGALGPLRPRHDQRRGGGFYFVRLMNLYNEFYF